MSIATPAKAPGFIGVFSPIVRRILKIGPLLGPNTLITISGRKSGQPRPIVASANAALRYHSRFEIAESAAKTC